MFRNQVGVISVKKLRFYKPYMYFPEKGNVDDDATLIDYDIFGFIEFTVLLPHAVCSLRSAVCSLQSAVCSLQSAVCSLQSAVCKCHTPRGNGR